MRRSRPPEPARTRRSAARSARDHGRRRKKPGKSSSARSASWKRSIVHSRIEATSSGSTSRAQLAARQALLHEGHRPVGVLAGQVAVDLAAQGEVAAVVADEGEPIRDEVLAQQVLACAPASSAGWRRSRARAPPRARPGSAAATPPPAGRRPGTGPPCCRSAGRPSPWRSAARRAMSSTRAASYPPRRSGAWPRRGCARASRGTLGGAGHDR